jgi:hypothetical protein
MVRGIAARAPLAPSFTTVPDSVEIVLATQSDGAFSSTTSAALNRPDRCHGNDLGVLEGCGGPKEEGPGQPRRRARL